MQVYYTVKYSSLFYRLLDGFYVIFFWKFNLRKPSKTNIARLEDPLWVSDDRPVGGLPVPLHVKVVDVLQGPGQDHVGQDLQLGSLYVGLAEFGSNKTESFRSDRNNLHLLSWQVALNFFLALACWPYFIYYLLWFWKYFYFKNIFTLMTTLGVMTWAEVGSFLLATTSLMNSANLTTSTSTWSVETHCLPAVFSLLLPPPAVFYHRESDSQQKPPWSLLVVKYTIFQDKKSKNIWPSSSWMRRPEASCWTSWPSRELKGANLTLQCGDERYSFR